MINTTWLYEKQSTTITQEVLSVGVRLHWIWGLSVDVRPLEAKADMAEQNVVHVALPQHSMLHTLNTVKDCCALRTLEDK